MRRPTPAGSAFFYHVITRFQLGLDIRPNATAQPIGCPRPPGRPEEIDMKRLASAALAFCCTILLFAPSVSAAGLIRQSTQAARLPAYSRSDLQKLPSMPAFDDDFLPAGSGWRAALRSSPPR